MTLSNNHFNRLGIYVRSKWVKKRNLEAENSNYSFNSVAMKGSRNRRENSLIKSFLSHQEAKLGNRERLKI